MADLQRFLPVRAEVEWTQVHLVQSHRFGYQDVRFPRRFRTIGTFIWFDPIRAIQVNFSFVRHACKCSAPPMAGHDQCETVPPSFDTLTETFAKRVAAATTPGLDLTSD